MPTAPTVNINLLPKSDLEHSPVGRITTWAVTYGRYIMIGTEIIVLLAFIARFSLDRKLTDLKEEISQKQTILLANADFEQDVRSLQDRLAKIKSLLGDQAKPAALLTFLQGILPPDVSMSSVDISSDKLIVEATAGTTAGFSQFLTGLTANSTIGEIEIGDIQKQPGRGIQFKLTASLSKPQPKR